MSDNPDYYATLLAKYLRDDCTNDERATLERWYESLNRDMSLPDETELPVLAQKNWLAVAARIRAEPVDKEPVRPLPSTRNRPVWRWAVAASVGIALLAGGWFMVQQTDSLPAQGIGQPIAGQWLINTNGTNQPQTLTLADGSTVTLRPKSQMRYPVRFGGDLRTVQLSGEAFFAVQPDAAHPFVVQTSSVQVRVLGTSFTVRAFAGQPTAEVSVTTGRVSVSPANGKTSSLLTPNQRATLTVANGQVSRSLVAAPVVVNPKAVVNNFDFADTPVAEVFGVLEQAYGVTIRYDRQTLVPCTLTARLTDQPLFTKLDMICTSIGASYRVSGTDVLIEGTGCQ